MSKRILLYSYEYPPLGGGIANAVKHILFEYSKHPEFQIDFVTSALDNKSETTQLYPNVRYIKVAIGARKPEDYHKQKARHMLVYLLKSYIATWKLIVQNHYDLSHMFGYPGGLVPLLFRWRMPYIISLRGVDVPGHNDKFKRWYWIYKPVTKIIWRFATYVVGNSAGINQLAKLADPSLKPLMIANGVDVDGIKVYSETEKFSSFTITAGGTLLNHLKGINYLIDGFAKLNNEFPETRLRLYGTGPDADKLQQQVKDLNISNAVEFIGRVTNDHLKSELGKHHVMCLPTLNEGMSNAMLEALAAGLPLVITEVGGTAELLANQNGIIIPKHDSEAVYEALRKLYQEPDTLTKMSDNSRKLSLTMTWKDTANRYLELYDSVINHG